MLKLLQITWNELRREFADRSIWLNLAVIPAALVFFIGLASGGLVNERRLPLDVVDLDQSPASTQFIADLRASSPNIRVCPADPVCEMPDGLSEDAAAARLQNGNTLALLVLPQGYGAALESGTPITLVFRSEDQLNAPSIVQRAVDAQVQRANGLQVARRTSAEVADGFLTFSTVEERAFVDLAYQRAQEVWAENPVQVAYNIPESLSGTQQGFGQSTAGMGSMYVMFTVLAGTVTLLNERRRWTLQRMVMLPVARWQILGGKALTRWLMGMIQFIVAFAAGSAIMYGMAQASETTIRAPFGNDPLALFLLMAAFSACIAALAFFLAPMMRSEEQAGGVNLFLALTMGPLGGAWWPLAIVPEWMRMVGHISPVAWVMDGFQSLMFDGGNLSTVLLPIGVLFAAAAVLFTIGVLRFRYD